MKPLRGRTSRSFRQKISSRIAEADSLCLQLRTLLHENHLQCVCFAVELLARECLNNAVLHGNQNNADKSVWFHLRVGRKWIRLQVKDQGAGFAWRKARQRELDTSAPSGRGLRLCMLYAWRVRFNRQGNQITLWISKHKPTKKEGRNGCV